MLSSFGTQLRTYWALGPLNVARVAWYRLSIKYRLNAAVHLSDSFTPGSFFQPSNSAKALPTTSQWSSEAKLFGWLPVRCHDIPNWSMNHLSGSNASTSDKPWYELPDFDPMTGDIKGLWEASRMEWLPAMAQRAAAGDTAELERLESWLADWCHHNPPYQGVQWKCGQEASIRIMHLAMAKLFLTEEHSTPTTRQFLRVHLRRIYPTLSYALAQDNNHGTSEAAAMFIGGSWLLLEDASDKEACRWQAAGRKLLENRVGHLIQNDGSFSQHSVNYHRLMLDTLNLTEAWRVRHKLPEFSSAYRSKCQAAARWLRAFVNAETGNAPNIGANDSARLFSVADVGVRDFRPTVQLATVLFSDQRAYDTAPQIDAILDWYQITKPETLAPQVTNERFDEGGYAILRNDQSMVAFRLPRYQFRPSHADALHVDVWIDGQNVCPDAGTYSYNTDEDSMRYFAGTQSHNTIQFDSRDQMPRIGRFLFGSWLRPLPNRRCDFSNNDDTQANNASTSGYRDTYGAEHRRLISLDSTELNVEDRVSGFRDSAVLRWRVPTDAKLNESGVLLCKSMHLKVTANVKIRRCELVTAKHSQLYGNQNDGLVLEVEIDEPGTLATQIRLHPAEADSNFTNQRQASERIHDAHPTNPPSLRVTHRSGRHATH